MKKRQFALLVAAVLTVNTIAVCSADESSADQTFTVGICQYVQHQALDLATQGFQDALTEALGDRI